MMIESFWVAGAAVAGLGMVALAIAWHERTITRLEAYAFRTMQATEQCARYCRLMALASSPEAKPEGSGPPSKRPSVRAWADIGREGRAAATRRPPAPLPSPPLSK